MNPGIIPPAGATPKEGSAAGGSGRGGRVLDRPEATGPAAAAAPMGLAECHVKMGEPERRFFSGLYFIKTGPNQVCVANDASGIYAGIVPGAMIVSIDKKPARKWLDEQAEKLWQQEIRTVQELLGHKNVKTTMLYTHLLSRDPLGVRSPETPRLPDQPQSLSESQPAGLVAMERRDGPFPWAMEASLFRTVQRNRLPRRNDPVPVASRETSDLFL